MQDPASASTSCASLTGQDIADVAIIGGGFVGLWTALTIKELSPHSRVTIVEKDICGGGASGRNGGFAMTWWPKIASLLAFASVDEALFLAEASEHAIDEIEGFCREHHIDAHIQRSGWLWTATTDAQQDAWEATVRACEKVGAKPFERLSSSEVARRTGSPMHRAGVFERSNGTVQPANLVRGMKKVALAQGIRIYEHTAVQEISRSRPSTIRTSHGQIQADCVVLATNAWSAEISEIARLIVPVNSAIVVTDPIPERLKAIGWTGGESITDSQLMVGYYRTTRDGRIAYGKGTGALAKGGIIDSTFSHHAQSCQFAERDFRRAYPMLADVRLSHSWSGPIDRTYDSLPVFGTISGTEHIHYGVGWSGNGVAPSRLGGKILASMALRRDDEWTRCALLGRKARQFPPEPIRYLGGELVRNAVRRKEAREAEGLRPRRIDVALAGLAPSGLEDKS